MKRTNVRFLLFSLLILVTVAGPGPIRFPGGGFKGRPGVGCAGASGGIKGVPGVRTAKIPLQPKVLVRPPLPGAAGNFPRQSPLRLFESLVPRRALPEAPVPLSRQLEAHGELLQNKFSNGDWKGFVEQAEVRPPNLTEPARTHLESVGAEAKCLEDLDGLRVRIERPWNENCRPEELKGRLDRLQRSSEDAGLVRQVRHYLDRRARLEGQLEVAASVGDPLPGDGASVLRDLKVLGAKADHPLPLTREPLLGPPLPEPEPLSLRPAVKESLAADLPILTDLPAAEVQARLRMLQAIEAAAQRHWSRAVIALHPVRHPTPVWFSANRDDSSEQEQEQEKQVEQQLGRALPPEERLLARRLLPRKTVAEVVAVLRVVQEKEEGHGR